MLTEIPLNRKNEFLNKQNCQELEHVYTLLEKKDGLASVQCNGRIRGMSLKANVADVAGTKVQIGIRGMRIGDYGCAIPVSAAAVSSGLPDNTGMQKAGQRENTGASSGRGGGKLGPGKGNLPRGAKRSPGLQL